MYHPRDNLMGVETYTRDIRDKQLFIIYCLRAICRIKYMYSQSIARNMDYVKDTGFISITNKCWLEHVADGGQDAQPSSSGVAAYSVKKLYLLSDCLTDYLTG